MRSEAAAVFVALALLDLGVGCGGGPAANARRDGSVGASDGSLEARVPDAPSGADAAEDAGASANGDEHGDPSDAAYLTDAADAANGAEAMALLTCPELASAHPWQDALGGRTLADRGTIVSCAHVGSFTQAQVAQNSAFPQQLGKPTNGYELFIVQYVSEGRPDVAATVTALLYLPTGGANHVPIVAVDHATSGMGPSCGPTHTTSIVDSLAVPLVGLGYAVVATDYAGMGVDNGMTSYLVGDAEAAETLDSVRALLRFHEARFDAAQLGADFFVMGHSQGAHAALFTHAAFDPGVGVNLLGSVSFAPGLGNAKDWSAFFNSVNTPVSTLEVFAAMSLYSRMLWAGGPAASTWLSTVAQTQLPVMVHDDCSTSLLSVVPARFGAQGDLYQQSFLAASQACSFQSPCSGFEPWSSALIADQPGDFASAVPAFIAQGSADTIVPPATTACIVQRLTSRGTPVQACSYAGADHTSIVTTALPDALRWLAARRAGGTATPCATTLSATCG
ncbi:MAG TPA: lipase family protein [Polyangiaceae bacterium]|nr:lipase family protein [Polyangiaceae bacterium]